MMHGRVALATILAVFIVGYLVSARWDPKSCTPAIVDARMESGSRVLPSAPDPTTRIEATELGQVDVRVEDGRVVMHANQAPRRQVLARLARAGRFEVRDYTDSDPLVTASVDLGTWPEAIAQTVRDSPYAIRYERADHGGAERILTLEVGASPRESASLDKGEAIGGIEALDEAPRWKVRGYTPAETANWLRGRAERRERRHREVLAGLNDDSSEERAFAVFSLDPTDPRSIPLLENALLDADPKVRLEAVAQLGLADPHSAALALETALSDSSPEVVVGAIEELSQISDPGARDAVEGLAQHVDGNVRYAARDALESMN